MSVCYIDILSKCPGFYYDITEHGKFENYSILDSVTNILFRKKIIKKSEICFKR